MQYRDTYLVADGVAQQRNRMGLPLHDTATSVGWLLIRCFITTYVYLPRTTAGAGCTACGRSMVAAIVQPVCFAP